MKARGSGREDSGVQQVGLQVKQGWAGCREAGTGSRAAGLGRMQGSKGTQVCR